MSEEKECHELNIYQRINAVMQEVDYIQKGQAKVAGQYRFCSHDQVVARLHGPLTKHGIVVLPTIKEKSQIGNRTEILLEVKFVNMDEPADCFCVDSLGYGIDPADKGPGKAISYALKYALLKTFCLETGDDPDQDQKSVHKPEAAPAPDPQLTEFVLRNFIKSYPDDDHKLLEEYIRGTASRYKKNILVIVQGIEKNIDGFNTAFEKYKADQIVKAFSESEQVQETS